MTIKTLKNLMILCSLIFPLISCSTTEIVWNDFRTNKDEKFEIELSFSDENQDYGERKYIERKIKKGTKSCKFIPSEFQKKFSGCTGNIRFSFYLTKEHAQLEIFLFDTPHSEKLSYNEMLSTVDGVFAYSIRFYDPELSRYCVLISKDNVFNVKKEDIEINTFSTMTDYLKRLDYGDVGYYEPVLSEEDKKHIVIEDYVNYFVESKISDYIFEISPSVGVDIYCGFRKNNEKNSYEVEYFF